MTEAYKYYFEAELKRVVDGDTVDLVVDLGFNVKINERFRMKGYNAPETWRPKSEEERQAGEKATEHLKSLLEGKELSIKSEKTGKYGRWICVIYAESPDEVTDVNAEMIEFCKGL